eukprot:1715742-Rhodomonas_salina.1
MERELCNVCEIKCKEPRCLRAVCAGDCHGCGCGWLCCRQLTEVTVLWLPGQGGAAREDPDARVEAGLGQGICAPEAQSCLS